MEEQQQQRIGRFEVKQRLGRGAQGSVYLARDPSLERLVAVKLLNASNPELTALDEDGRTPLEGRIASRLRHPNIVFIYDAGEFKGLPYLVFEYVQGKTLRHILSKHGALPLERVCALIGPILDGMAAAHEEDVIHLDLNPRNVLLDKDERPRIMDFGLSQLVGRVKRSNDTATGTLRYMAPEHFRGGELGPATDVFALGSTFYELVAGRPAMQGDSAPAIIHQLCEKSVDMTPLQGWPAGELFAAFLKGALEKDAAARYRDAGAMRDAFRLFLQESGLGEQAQSQSHSTVEFLLRRMQRKQDFPTISRTLVDINRLTASGSDAPAEKLANVILRDYALTSKLLKLVNSAFYGHIANEVTSISHAVMILGFEKVRMIANSLTFFGRLQGSPELKDATTRSFMCGLIARHLARRRNLAGAEEAFIYGLFRNLGENLVIYYFPEEHGEIRRLMVTRGLSKLAASRGVLGVSYEDLGAAVARVWKLPDTIIDVIRGLPNDDPETPASEAERLRDIAIFAEELCDVAGMDDHAAQDEALARLVERFEPSVDVTAGFAGRLVAAGADKLRQYAPVFEIDVAGSSFCRSAIEWSLRYCEGGGAAAAEAAGETDVQRQVG
mgnify:FL=1